jgi:VIT1/CCC1 family predicted Fe2+/Mn2+ transporter
MHDMSQSSHSVAYFRNFIFGVEDSLVSTVGLLSGIAIAGMTTQAIFLTGMVLIFVESLSMSAGSFLSEASAKDFSGDDSAHPKHTYVAAGIMFASYFVSGFVPLSPYIFLPVESAFPVSVGVSIASLFILGIVSGTLSRVSLVRSGLRMALIGGAAIVVGVTAGRIFG